MAPIYSHRSITKMDELKVLPKRCVIALFPLQRSATFLYSSSLLPIELLREVERLTQIHKMVLNLTKHCFRIVTKQAFHGRTTQHPGALHLFMDQNVLTKSIFNYNRIDADLHWVRNIGVFFFC